MNQKPRLELKRRGVADLLRNRVLVDVPMHRLGSAAPRKREVPLVLGLDENWRAPTVLSLVSMRKKGVVGYEEIREAWQANGRTRKQQTRWP
jgi:hypothetical protein